jgi:hypothetical protein
MEASVQRLYDEQTGRRITLTHYSILGQDAVERIQTKAPRYPGGIDGPQWRAEYELDWSAQPGDVVFKKYGQHNIKACGPDSTYPQFLSFDFGHTDATACHAAQVTPTQVQVYYEHYLSGEVASVHKSRIYAALMQWPIFRTWAKKHGDGFFNCFIAVGDPSGPNYMAQYAQPPKAMFIRKPSDEPNYRDKFVGESILDAYFGLQKRCCWQQWDDKADECPTCKRPLQFAPGLVLDPRCVRARQQILAQVNDDDGKRVDVPNHAVDSLVYLARRIRTVKQAPPKAEDLKPWWLQGYKKKDEIDPIVEKAYGSNEIIMRFFK